MSYRAEARRAASREMARRGWVIADVARASGLDPSTITDFLSGERWPRRNTLAKLDTAFEWPAGTLDDIVATGVAGSFYEQPPTGPEAGEKIISWREGDENVYVSLRVPAETVEHASVADLYEARSVAVTAFLTRLREIRASSPIRMATESDDEGGARPPLGAASPRPTTAPRDRDQT